MRQSSSEQLKRGEGQEMNAEQSVKKILAIVDALRGYKEGSPVWEKFQKRITEEYEGLTQKQKKIYNATLEQRKNALMAIKKSKEDQQNNQKGEELPAGEASQEEMIAKEDVYTNMLDNPRAIKEVQEKLFTKASGERFKKERSPVNRVAGLIEDKLPIRLQRVWQDTMRGQKDTSGALALIKQIQDNEGNPWQKEAMKRTVQDVQDVFDILKKRFDVALQAKEIDEEEYNAIMNFVEKITPNVEIEKKDVSILEEANA